MAEKCVNDNPLELLKRAARLHDLGKADERFQRQLNNGHRFGATQLLAKSRTKIPMARWEQLRTLVGLPKYFRHEMLSMQMAAVISENEPFRDLLLHLIAAHHGYARPFAPISVDENPPDVDVLLQEEKYSITGASREELPPHRLDSGIAGRFWRLNRQYGWWGLAYLESLLRLADWRASREMEEGGFQ
jgi:CRISPR-associated endonuclease/helicase Cas3